MIGGNLQQIEKKMAKEVVGEILELVLLVGGGMPLLRVDLILVVEDLKVMGLSFLIKVYFE